MRRGCCGKGRCGCSGNGVCGCNGNGSQPCSCSARRDRLPLRLLVASTAVAASTSGPVATSSKWALCAGQPVSQWAQARSANSRLPLVCGQQRVLIFAAAPCRRRAACQLLCRQRAGDPCSNGPRLHVGAHCAAARTRRLVPRAAGRRCVALLLLVGGCLRGAHRPPCDLCRRGGGLRRSSCGARDRSAHHPRGPRRARWAERVGALPELRGLVLWLDPIGLAAHCAPAGGARRSRLRPPAAATACGCTDGRGRGHRAISSVICVNARWPGRCDIHDTESSSAITVYTYGYAVVLGSYVYSCCSTTARRETKLETKLKAESRLTSPCDTRKFLNVCDCQTDKTQCGVSCVTSSTALTAVLRSESRTV